ncbi:luciferase [Streptomyces sp. AA4]|nr:luciferase [Streptomyces sp. AA4]
MELGLQVPDFTLPGGAAALGTELAEAARAADDAGFAYLAVMDHFFQIPSVGPSDRPMLEAYTTLGYFAAHTRRAKLFTYVTGAIYRHPGLLAKAVSTLDVLSGGRAMLGIGAGWNEEEARGLGFPFPSTSEPQPRSRHPGEAGAIKQSRGPAARRRRFGSSRSTATSATSATARISNASSTCSSGTAKPRAVTTARSPKPSTTIWTSGRPGRKPANFSPRPKDCTGSGCRP